jgi:ATP-dependent Clp protease ATP-binding subunit ClpA
MGKTNDFKNEIIIHTLNVQSDVLNTTIVDKKGKTITSVIDYKERFIRLFIFER